MLVENSVTESVSVVVSVIGMVVVSSSVVEMTMVVDSVISKVVSWD